jgi:hypothetical protein
MISLENVDLYRIQLRKWLQLLNNRTSPLTMEEQILMQETISWIQPIIPESDPDFRELVLRLANLKSN